MPVVQAPYCARADLSTYGTTAAALEDIDVDVQDRCIVAASSRIAGALKSQVNLPLTDWGHDIVRAAAILAAHDALMSSGDNPEGEEPDSPEQRRYEEVVAWLNAVANGLGTSAVGSPSPAPDTGASPGGAAVYSNVLRGWQNSSRPGAFTGRRR